MVQRTIETFSLFVVIAVVVLRPLVGESYESAASPMTNLLVGVSDPSATRTLVFDLLILLGAGGWALARALGSNRQYRRTGLEWGTAIVLIASVISCFAAGNKRLAINGSIDWLCFPLLTITLTQLLRRPWHRHILIAGVLASAVVMTARCCEQYFVDFEATTEQYASMRENYWADQGVELDSPKVAMFEGRLNAREATGTLTHSNLTGSYLVLCGLAALGVGVSRWRRRVSKDQSENSAGVDTAGLTTIGVIAIAVAILAATFLTGSKGAIISGVLALALWVVLCVRRTWIDQRRRTAAIIAWAVAVAGILAVAGHGLYHGKLPGWSLTFRWQYWTASAQLIADHPMTGIGRENFGRHYLHYKSIRSPEEVSTPHNLFIQAASDWGLLGLLGFVLMMIGVTVIWVRRGRAPPDDIDAEQPDQLRFLAALTWAGCLGAVVTLARVPLLDVDNPSFAYYTTVTTGLIWLPSFLLFLAAQNSNIRRDTTGHLASAGIAVGLLAFLVHDMINFALFVPATATTFFALLGACLASPCEVEKLEPSRRGAGRWLPIGVVAGLIAMVVDFGLRPVSRSTAMLAKASAASRLFHGDVISNEPAAAFFQQAAIADPLDPTPHARLARWLLSATNRPELIEQATAASLESINNAIARDPHNVGLRRNQMRVHMRLAKQAGREDEWQAAIAAAEDVVELYPKNPRDIVALADRQREAGEATQSAELLRASITSYERALKLDNDRISWEEVWRFRQREIDEIRKKIENAKSLASS